MTWGELIRRLQTAGFIEPRRGKGSHRQFVHPDNGRVADTTAPAEIICGVEFARSESS